MMSDENKIYPGKPVIPAEAILAELAHRNDRIVPKLPESLRKLPPVRIFNVCDMKWERNMGGIGTFLIQPCAPGMPCSPPLEIPMIFTEAIPVGNLHFEYRIHDGREVAQSIVGCTRVSGNDEDLRKWGVFIAKGEKPTPDELKEANIALLDTYARLSAEAIAFYREPKVPGETWPIRNITAMHRKALKAFAAQV